MKACMNKLIFPKFLNCMASSDPTVIFFVYFLKRQFLVEKG